MSTFLPVSYMGISATAWEYMQLLPALPLASGSLVSCVPGPLRVPSLRPYFSVRLRLTNGLRIKLSWICSLTPGVRARLKAVSADSLRIPIRPASGAFVRTHGTRKGSVDLQACFRCSSVVDLLHAFYGALKRSLIRFAYPFRPMQLKIATPLHGFLNPKFTERVYVA